jgi:hypothetical protein
MSSHEPSAHEQSVNRITADNLAAVEAFRTH